MYPVMEVTSKITPYVSPTIFTISLLVKMANRIKAKEIINKVRAKYFVMVFRNCKGRHIFW